MNRTIVKIAVATIAFLGAVFLAIAALTTLNSRVWLLFLVALLLAAGLAFAANSQAGGQNPGGLLGIAGSAIVGGVFAVILALGVLSLTTGTYDLLSKSGDNGTQDESSMAYIQCQEFVKYRLKLPSSVNFPPRLSSEVHIARPTPFSPQYSVMSYVDIPDSLGARLRSPFICDVKKSRDGRWNLIGLILE